MSKRAVTPLLAANGKAAGRLVKVGGMLFSSSITGIDLASGSLSGDPAQQIASAFANLGALLGRAGASADELGLMTVCIAEGGHARHVAQCWRSAWPDAGNRPALKINEYALPPGELVQIQLVGAIGQKRQAIDLPGFTDGQPLGVRLGPVVFAAPIDGRDPATGMLSNDRVTQMRQAFRNMDSFIQRAGGSKYDLIHVYIFVSSRDEQADMLDVWLEEFPTDGERPARKAIFDETLARDGKMIHLMCVGVIGQGDRLNIEVPGISKHHPNPMGAKIGGLVLSSGIGGDDPSGKVKSRDPTVCAGFAFRNMATLLESSGGSLDDIGLVAITVNDYVDEPAILAQWRKLFPDPASEPARHVMAFGGRGSYPVQVHVFGALGKA